MEESRFFHTPSLMRERERERPFHLNRLTYVCVCGVNYQSSIVIYYPCLCNQKTRKVRQVCQKEMSAQSFSIFYLNCRTSSESSDKEELYLFQYVWVEVIHRSFKTE